MIKPHDHLQLDFSLHFCCCWDSTYYTPLALILLCYWGWTWMPHPPASASGVLALQAWVICPASPACILLTRTENLFFLTYRLQGSWAQGIFPCRSPIGWEPQCSLHNNIFPMGAFSVIASFINPLPTNSVISVCRQTFLKDFFQSSCAILISHIALFPIISQWVNDIHQNKTISYLDI